MLSEVLSMLLWAAAIVAGGLGLMLWDARAWRAALKNPLEEGEYQFRRRRFRRHLQMGALATAMAAAVPVGTSVMFAWPRVGVLVWGGVLVLVAWLCILALADVVATVRHYRQLRDQCLQEQLRLQGALYRAHGRRRKESRPKSPEEPPPDAGDG